MITHPPQTYDEALGEILKIPMFGNAGMAAMNYSLDRMHRWCRHLGNPQKKLPIIHVAGTNGKGTTCRMLAAVYEQAGYRTALYTSPHLTDLRERIRYQLQMIPKDAVLTFCRENHAALKDDTPTFFELLTLLAFWYFEKEHAEIAIIETGLGGRLDATNIITPQCTVITSIGMDHCDILGDTLAKIAAEKAGIIKPDIPLILGELPQEAREVIIEHAEAMKAPVTEPLPSTRVKKGTWEQVSSPAPPTPPSPSNLASASISKDRPPTDRINQTIVKNTVRALQKTFPVSDLALHEGLTHWHERIGPHANFEKMACFESETALPRTWYFSGAHNLQAWEDLTSHMNAIAPPSEWTVVVTLMSDKIAPSMREIFEPYRKLYLYAMDSERAATSDMLQQTLPWGTIIQEPSEIPTQSKQKERSGLVIFTGSLYFYSTVERWVQTIQTTVFRG